MRSKIQTLFNQRVNYKKQESPLQEAFKLTMNSEYKKIIMKDINIEHHSYEYHFMFYKNNIETSGKFCTNSIKSIQELILENRLAKIDSFELSMSKEKTLDFIRKRTWYINGWLWRIVMVRTYTLKPMEISKQYNKKYSQHHFFYSDYECKLMSRITNFPWDV